MMTMFVLICRCMLRVVVQDSDSIATFELCDSLLKDIPSLDYDELVGCLLLTTFINALGLWLTIYWIIQFKKGTCYVLGSHLCSEWSWISKIEGEGCALCC